MSNTLFSTIISSLSKCSSANSREDFGEIMVIIIIVGAYTGLKTEDDIAADAEETFSILRCLTKLLKRKVCSSTGRFGASGYLRAVPKLTNHHPTAKSLYLVALHILTTCTIGSFFFNFSLLDIGFWFMISITFIPYLGCPFTLSEQCYHIVDLVEDYLDVVKIMIGIVPIILLDLGDIFFEKTIDLNLDQLVQKMVCGMRVSVS